SGVKIIKAFNATPFVKDRFNGESAYYSKIMRRMVRRQQMSSPVSELLGVVMVAVILLYGGNLVLTGQGELAASEFNRYIAISSQVMRPANTLRYYYTNIHNGRAARERVIALIFEKRSVIDKPDATDITTFEEGMTFQDVDFAYGEKQVVIDFITVMPK